MPMVGRSGLAGQAGRAVEGGITVPGGCSSFYLSWVKEEAMSRLTTAWSEKVDASLAGFIDYLRDQRCVSPLTVEAYAADARRFLERRGQRGLRGLSAGDVSRAILREAD